MVAGLLAAIACLAADVDAMLLWEEFRGYREQGNDDHALRVLAELSTVEEHQVAALLQASLIYLRLGRPEQANSILAQLARRPEMANDPDFLIHLYAVQQDAAAMRQVVENYPYHLWQGRSLLLAQDAYRRLGIDIPPSLARLPERRQAVSQTSVELSLAAYRNHPFRQKEASADLEYASHLTLSYARPWSSQWRAVGTIKLAEEWSEPSPKTFSPYRVRRLGIAGGGVWQAEDAQTEISLIAGGFFSQALKYPGTDRPDLPPQADLEAKLSHLFGQTRLLLRHVEGSFVVPSFCRLELERYRRTTIRLQRPLRPNLQAELYASHIHFSGDLEDYHELGGRLRLSPSWLAGGSLFLEAEREFRAEPESLLAVGIDWGRKLSGNNLLILLARFEANLDTGERNMELQAFTGVGRAFRGNWSLGIGFTAELTENENRLAHLLLRWQPGQP